MSTALRKRPARSWLSIPERGTALGMATFVWGLGLGGRRLGRALLWLVMPYYVLSSPRARRASRDFRRRVGPDAERHSVFTHIMRFGQVALDRLLLVQGKTGDLEVDLGPRELYDELQQRESGALLLSAHVGSFEALAGLARERTLDVVPVVNTGGSRIFTDVLERLNPKLAANLIDLADGRLEAIFKIRERLESGRHVGILCDRWTEDEKSIAVPFMGQEARFPAGPFILASTLKCPVYFVAALYRGGNRYEIHAERFADQVTLPRKARDEGLKKWAGLYSQRLEALARRAPLNWFNFYDFWQKKDQDTA
ncbi:MAG: lipid A biosynthesis acyltransferase [Nannocystales bacterium]